MFDSIRLVAPTHQPETIHHHEHRAPTDESIRLLKELEEKAREKLLFSAECIAPNDLRFSWHVFNNECSRSLQGVCKLNLNGTNHDFGFTIQKDDLFRPADKLALKIRDLVAEQVANWISLDAIARSITINRIEK